VAVPVGWLLDRRWLGQVEVVVDGAPADAQRPGDDIDVHPLRVQLVEPTVVLDAQLMAVLTRLCQPLPSWRQGAVGWPTSGGSSPRGL